jgi:hypothetical protein
MWGKRSTPLGRVDKEFVVDVYWAQNTCQGGAPVTTFRRIKIQATVETAPMLLTEDQIDGALRKLRDGLTQLDVAIVGIEAKEEPAIELPPTLEYRD